MVFETESNDLGIVEAFHFDDDASISCQIFSELEVGQRIKTIFLAKKHDCLVFSCKRLLIQNVGRALLKSFQYKVGTQHFGYVTENTRNGSFITFIGSVRGFLPNLQCTIGDTVSVYIKKEGIIPQLELDQTYYLIDKLDTMVDYINSKRDNYSVSSSVGDIINLDGAIGEREENNMIFKRESETLIVLNCNDKIKQCMVVDIQANTIFAIDTNRHLSGLKKSNPGLKI